MRKRLVQRTRMPARRIRVHLGTIAAGVAVFVTVSGCSIGVTPTSSQASSLTERETSVARRLVAETLGEAGDGAVLDGAWATLSSETVSQPNTGHPCESKRLILVQMRGVFPNIVTSGGPPTLEGDAPVDASVSALRLTSDSESELVCLIGVETGDVEPLPDAADLRTASTDAP